MAKFLFLSAKDIERVFTMEDALAAVEDAYAQKALGKGVAWPMIYEQFDPGVADMDIRSGELAGSGLFGLKLTSWFSRNPECGLPDIYGTTLLCSDVTGEPLALLNASAITGLRTGAAAGLGAKWLARRDAHALLVAGTGHMAAFVIAGILEACPGIESVSVWNPKAKTVPEARVQCIRKDVSAILAACPHARELDSYAIGAVDDGERAAACADVIATVTPSTSPIIEKSWIKPGTHISCVGADMPGKQELACDLVASARLYVDDRDQSVSSGELEIAVAQGAIAESDIVAELGEVVVGAAPAREDDSHITVFDTSGIAVQDLAASKIAYDRAVEAGIGSYVEL